jgi:hypothetical protein
VQFAVTGGGFRDGAQPAVPRSTSHIEQSPRIGDVGGFAPHLPARKSPALQHTPSTRTLGNGHAVGGVVTGLQLQSFVSSGESPAHTLAVSGGQVMVVGGGGGVIPGGWHVHRSRSLQTRDWPSGQRLAGGGGTQRPRN